MKKKNITGLVITIAVFAAVILFSIYFFSNNEPIYLQGQVEAKQINVAPKVPGRVKAIYKKEGDRVQKGELLLELESTEIDAKLSQAEAARSAAQAQSDKAQHGAREEQIKGAYNVWQQAQAAADLAEKTYQRVSNLFNDKVLPAQKKDEAYTQMVALQKQAEAAKSQYEMAKNGYLTDFVDFNDQYISSKEKQLIITANLQPIPDLQINLKANRQYTENYTETFEVRNFVYNKLVGNQVGSFNISTNLLASSFNKIDEYNSAAFEKFKNNRLTIARRLADARGLNPASVDAEGYPVGYSKKSQAVMIPAFVAAYSGSSASGVSLDAFKNIPIPEWNVRYTGLMRVDFIKNIFKRFSLAHGYRASYSLSEFRTNLEYEPANPNKTNVAGDFLNDKLYSTVTLAEQFNPLLRADMELKNSMSLLAEFNRDRTISISLDNDYLTEILKREYKFGMGYRFKDLAFVTQLAGTPTTVKSDLVLKGTLSYLREFTVIRNMEIFNNQVTAGQTSWIGNFSAEYALSRNLLASYYLQYNFSKSAISTSFPMTTFRTGVSVKYTFQ